MKMKNQPDRHQDHHPPPKLKPPHRPFLSCAFFRHCTESTPSPTNPQPPPPLPLSSSSPNNPAPTQRTPSTPLPPPIAPQRQEKTTPLPPRKPDSESSSSSTSQSFTQWRFPPTFHNQPPSLEQSSRPLSSSDSDNGPPQPDPPPPPQAGRSPTPAEFNLIELFHVAQVQFTDGSEIDRMAALHMLEHTLVPNPPSSSTTASGESSIAVPKTVMDGIVSFIKQKPASKPATKVLLALCLSHQNRHVAVERGAAGRLVEALADLEGSTAERALAALELLCTVPEGAAEVRAHALAVPMLVQVMAKMEGRGREYAISVLAVIYGGAGRQGNGNGNISAPPEQVARAVVLAMQGENCSARGRRKGGQLLKALHEISNGRLDLTLEGR